MLDRINVFIIGSPKSGTTSLATYLGNQSGVFVPSGKEAHICDKDWRSEVVRQRATRMYHGLNDEKYVVDATPNYFLCPNSVWEFLETKQRRDRSTFIVVLREPISRLMSHVSHNQSRLAESRGLNEVVEEEIVIFESGGQSDYIDYGRYGFWLGQWLKLFDERQFVFIEQSRLKDLEYAAERLSSRIPLDNWAGCIDHENVGGVPRSKLLMQMIQSQGLVKSIVKLIIPYHLRVKLRYDLTNHNLKKNTCPEQLRPESYNALKKIYADDYVLLNKLVGLNVNFD